MAHTRGSSPLAPAQGGSRQSEARQRTAGLGKAWDRRRASGEHRRFESPAPALVEARFGLARHGLARRRAARDGGWMVAPEFDSPAPTQGRACPGIAGLGVAGPGESCPGSAVQGRGDGERVAHTDGSSPRRSRWARLGHASLGSTWPGEARPGPASLGAARELEGGWHASGFKPSTPAHGPVRLGGAGQCTAWRGSARYGKAWKEGEWTTSTFESLTPACVARRGYARLGRARRREAWPRMARDLRVGGTLRRSSRRHPRMALPGMAVHGKARRRRAWERGGRMASTPVRGRSADARRGRTWRGHREASLGMAMPGLASPGMAWRGKGVRVDGLRCGSTPHHPRMASLVRAWRGLARPGVAWRDPAGLRAAWHGRRATGSHLGSRPGRSRMARLGWFWRGEAALGKARDQRANGIHQGPSPWRPRKVGHGIGSAGPGSARLGAARRDRSGHGLEHNGMRASGPLRDSSSRRPRRAGQRLAERGIAGLGPAGRGVDLNN